MSERLDVLLADQLFRWSRGLPKPVGEYLAEQPSLADEPEAILKLVQGESWLGWRPVRRPTRIPTRGPSPDWHIDPPPVRSGSLADDARPARTVDVDGHHGRLRDEAMTGAVRLGTPEVSARFCERTLVEADFGARCAGWVRAGMGEVDPRRSKEALQRVALELDPARGARLAVAGAAVLRRGAGPGPAAAPHIVGVHGIGRMSDGRYFLVMDLVEGGTTLAALLRQEPVPFDRAAGLVATVAEAIEHAHSRGVYSTGIRSRPTCCSTRRAGRT